MVKAIAVAFLLLTLLLFVACETARSPLSLAPDAALTTSPSAAQATAAVQQFATRRALTLTASPSSTGEPATYHSTVAADSRNKLSAPLRLAFYYPWTPVAWRAKGPLPLTHYTPTAGFYDTADTALIQQHIAAMQYGRIDAGIITWGGKGHATDQYVPALLAAAAGTAFRWSLYYEKEGEGDPTSAEIAADLAYLVQHYGGQPNYLQIDGRPVLFVYANTAQGEDSCAMVERWQQANVLNLFLVLKVFRGFRDCPAQPAGWHQYAPTVATSHQRGYSFSISPGFWAAHATHPRRQRDLTQWRQAIRAMVASGEPFQLITSFNDWNEGTAIEAATAWASASGFGDYVDALHQNGAEDIAVAAGAKQPWPTPEPTPLPIMAVTVTAVADTYVTQQNPTVTYGERQVLRTDITPTIHSYLRFTVPPIQMPLRQARLQLFANSRSNSGFEVRTMTTTAWNETALNFATAPQPGYVIASSGPLTAEKWIVLDLTARITQAGDLNLALFNLDDRAISYASRETATPPTLLLEFDSALSPRASRAVTATVVYAVGDIADCDAEGDDATATLLDHVDGPILTLGDTVYMSGTVQQFADCFDPVWGRHKTRIRPAVGNHEYLTPNAAPYYAYFGAAAGAADKGYYSYALGDWHVVVLNTNCSEVGGCQSGSPQEQWLRADLAAHPTHCTLAYFHHPRWSSGKYGENERIYPLVETLDTYGVDLMLAGHAHHYERFAPQDAAGHLDRRRGIRQIVVGTGGKNHEPIISVLPNSEIREAATFGVLQLHLYPDRYAWDFLPVPGSVFTDWGEDVCH